MYRLLSILSSHSEVWSITKSYSFCKDLLIAFVHIDLNFCEVYSLNFFEFCSEPGSPAL